MRNSWPPPVAAALLGTLVLWGCGGGSSPSSPTAPTAVAAPPVAAAAPPAAATPPAAAAPATVSVSIVASTGNQAFTPNPVRASAGDTVVFRNTDGTLHHVVLDDGSGDFGEVTPGATSRGIVLRTASALSFHCTIHATMVGSINGLTAPATPPCVPDSYGYGC